MSCTLSVCSGWFCDGRPAMRDTMRPLSRNGSPFNNAPLTTQKTVVLRPSPRPSVTIETSDSVGYFTSIRRPERTSVSSCDMAWTRGVSGCYVIGFDTVPSVKCVGMKVRFFRSPAELRDWFDRHHETEQELWVGFHHKSAGKPTLTWSESVDEALCVGWIDGIRKRHDATSYKIRFTPRRKGSIWSAVNLRKVEDLKQQGRMRPAGLKAFDARDPAKCAIYSY